MIFRRRERPPDELLALLERDERIVSWADTDAVPDDPGPGSFADSDPGGSGDIEVSGDVEATASEPGGVAVVAASNRGLWVPGAISSAYRRIGWELLDKAVWRDGVLTVIEAELVDNLLLHDRPPLYLRLTVPRDLPPTVRRRVEASVVRSDVFPVTGGTARFVARRVPGRDGVSWWARLEPGTRDTEQTRAAVRARCAQLAAQWAGQTPS